MKAEAFVKTGCTVAFDTAVVNSDTQIEVSLQQALKSAVRPLDYVPEGQKDYYPGRILPDQIIAVEACFQKSQGVPPRFPPEGDTELADWDIGILDNDPQLQLKPYSLLCPQLLVDDPDPPTAVLLSTGHTWSGIGPKSAAYLPSPSPLNNNNTTQPTIMNRLFGTKSTGPKPTLEGAISNVDTRVSSIDVKLAALNSELSTYQAKIAKMRDGPGKNALRQKALKVLQRRKQYEAQRDQLSQQSWNMEQAGMMQDNLKNVMTTVDAMKTTTKELKKQYGKVDIDKIEQMQDEMADLMEVGNEIQESISRAYDVPEDVDEAELDAELEALGEESMFESSMGESAMPSFLQDEVAPPQFIDEPPEQHKVKEAAGGLG
ncbi:hypothetical protein PENVUL_c005G01745 [Penicillium vulpinum]|uniref:DUF4246 domain-containing protein n=2 Tax=Penicillium vulpinum TaxID=29845 RepID=A0A1V6S7A9_9EURO|nr:hypothetical protein PENVUL_c005G01745 [Penicillium vulpinum]